VYITGKLYICAVNRIDIVLMKFSELHRRLERSGWYIVKETDHRYYGHENFPHLIKVGRHGSKEVPPNEFNKVMKAAGLK